jgi:hypothetical protein
MLVLAWLLQAAIVNPSPALEVGDPVTVSVRVRVPDGATLIDRVPRTRDTLPDGVRLLSADTLRRDGGAWVGRVRVAFFRPDSQSVPALAVAYRLGSAVDTAVTAPIAVIVRHVLPEGSGTLRDIRDIDTPIIPWDWLLAGVAVLVPGVLVMRLRRRRVIAREVSVVTVPAAPAPLDVALAALAAIEDEGWDAERRAEAAADVVRRYLEVARGIPALERTTPEVRRLVGGNGAVGALHALLADADRVKFARGVADAGFVERARDVLKGLAA